MANPCFVVGKKYSRKDIFSVLQLNPFPIGGNWFTGYTKYLDEHYVFVNVNTAGRTGHNYGDRWLEDGSLFWHGKTNSHIGQPVIQDMIRKGAVVHFFTRDDNRDVEFVYQGIGTAVTVNLTSPVEIIWRFDKQ